ncbi:UNKNOWN [Stylonychia lemnae]|uniref:Transmembrane protein n=1 Tax=Stylonychia lemnae TaxID=5949 RepID=A0A077ZT12_STYLE|nr:UNKNOWN [Stylonychia lemnae]|eukprot:CDW72450.1 UNKNOWN [Stylonychia lemnae]
MIRKKQNLINKATDQKRRDYLNEKRLNENIRDKNVSAKQYLIRKELKKEMTLLMDKNYSDNDSSDSDMSYEEFKDIMMDDPTRLFYPDDIQNKQQYRKQLQYMLEDYNQLNMFRHIFPSGQSNEYHLLKLDLMFDNSFWDRELFGLNRKDNKDMYDVIKLLRFPIFWMTSKLYGENSAGLFNIYEPNSIYQHVFANSWTTVLVLITLMVMFVFRSQLKYKTYFNIKDKEQLVLIQIGACLFFAGFSIMLIDMRSDISVIDLFGFFLSIVGYLFYYLGIDEQFYLKDAQSAIQSIKANFDYVNSKELEEVDLKLLQIYSILGLKGLYRVIFDTALAQNKRQLYHTSDPVLEQRSQFDVYFDSRRAVWGGSYPRPSVEMIEKAWKLNMKQLQKGQCGVRIDLDPEIDYATYPEALHKWEVIKQWRQEEENKELEYKIQDTFKDVVEFSSISDKSITNNFEFNKNEREEKKSSIFEKNNSLLNDEERIRLKSNLKKQKKKQSKKAKTDSLEPERLNDIQRQQYFDQQKKMQSQLMKEDIANQVQQRFVEFKGSQSNTMLIGAGSQINNFKNTSPSKKGHLFNQSIQEQPYKSQFEELKTKLGQVAEEQEENEDFEELDFTKIREKRSNNID